MYNKNFKLKANANTLKSIAFSAFIGLGLAGLQSCATADVGTVKIADWAKNRKIKNVLIVEQSEVPEDFKTDLIYNIRKEFTDRGITNYGINYSNKMVNAEETLKEKLDETNPDFLIYLRHTYTYYENNAVTSYSYNVKISDQENKAFMLKTDFHISRRASSLMAKELIKLLEKEGMLNKK